MRCDMRLNYLRVWLRIMEYAFMDIHMRVRFGYACVVFNPRGNSFIEPLFPIVPNESVNFCLRLLVPYDKGGSSLDFLDFAFFICLCKPFGYVFSVNNGQWKGFRIYGIIVFWCDLFIECYTITAPTDGKHQQFICFER